MEVILLERIEKIGKLGDVVKVKNGYARNYLLPQKKALRANKENIKIYEKQKKVYEEKNADLLKEAQSKAKTVDNLSISLIKQASDSGQLYGSVAAREISDTIKSLGHDIQTKQIQLKKAIKEIGTHKVKIIIHPEVITSVTVKVARSNEELMSDTLIEENIKDDDAKNSNQTDDKNSELVEKPINESSSKSTKKQEIKKTMNKSKEKNKSDNKWNNENYLRKDALKFI